MELSGTRASTNEGGGAGEREWEKQKIEKQNAKVLLERYRGRERDWHSDVNRERRVDWMKKLHTGEFLKSPFNMYEGSSIDSASHKQATEQKGEESRNAGCLEKKELFSCQQILQCVRGDWVQRKGTTQRLCLLSPTFPWHNKTTVYRRLSVNHLPTKLRLHPSAIASLHRV